MKNKIFSIAVALFIVTIAASCKKESYIDNHIIDDKDKIDIKGTLSNGQRAADEAPNPLCQKVAERTQGRPYTLDEGGVLRKP